MYGIGSYLNTPWNIVDLGLIIIEIGFSIYLGYILYKIALNSNINGLAKLGFIPIANVYLLHTLLSHKLPKFVSRSLWIIYGILFLLSLFTPKLGIACYLILAYYIFHLLKEFGEQKAVIHIVIGIITATLSYSYSLSKYKNNAVIIPNLNVAITTTLKDFLSSKIATMVSSVETHIDDQISTEDESSVTTTSNRNNTSNSNTNSVRNTNGSNNNEVIFTDFSSND